MSAAAGGRPRRRLARRALERLLAHAGARIATEAEDRAAAAVHARQVRELVAIYEATIFTELKPREGRLELLGKLRGTTVPEALYLLDRLQGALTGPGDVCEMGVAQGATSALLAAEIEPTTRTLWLYDSFEGLSAPTREDVLLDDVLGLGEMSRYRGAMASPESEVRRRLAEVGFPASRTRIISGFIRPDLSPAELPDQVAFAYLDFDLYEPILTGLRLLDSRCRAGSVLIVDDYGYFSAGAKTAVETFLDETGDSYQVSLPIPAAGHFCMLERR